MISLIHPSYGRPTQARQAHDEWQAKASNWNDIDYILSLDLRDNTQAYEDAFNGTDVTIIINDNENCVQATNIAAENTVGEILLYLSDDFGCPPGWDLFIEKRLDIKEPQLLKVYDGLQPMHIAVLTIPIMTRKLYEKLGYFWFPEYESMCVDEDLFWETKPYHVLAPEAIFEHRHYSVAKSPVDETYRQHDNDERLARGKQLFHERRKLKGW